MPILVQAHSRKQTNRGHVSLKKVQQPTRETRSSPLSAPVPVECCCEGLVGLRGMEQRLIENIPICCRQDNLIVLLEDSFVRQNLVAIDQYDNDGHFVSSATCIDIGKRVFLCTAAHNFKGIPKGGKVSFFSTHPIGANTPLNVVSQNYSDYGDPICHNFHFAGACKELALRCRWFRTGNLSTRAANKTRRLRRRPQNFGNGVAELLVQAERRFSCADARHLYRFLRAF